MFVLKSTHTTSFASSIIYLFWYESVTPIPRFPEGWGGRVVKWTNPAFIEKNIDMCLNPQLQVSIELNEPVELTFALRYLNFFTKVCTASNLPNYTHSTSITLFLKHIHSCRQPKNTVVDKTVILRKSIGMPSIKIYCKNLRQLDFFVC